MRTKHDDDWPACFTVQLPQARLVAGWWLVRPAG